MVADKYKMDKFLNSMLAVNLTRMLEDLFVSKFIWEITQVKIDWCKNVHLLFYLS